MKETFTHSISWTLSAAAAIEDLVEWGSDNRNIIVKYEKSYDGKLVFTVSIETDPTIDTMKPGELIKLLHPELSAKVEEWIGGE